MSFFADFIGTFASRYHREFTVKVEWHCGKALYATRLRLSRNAVGA
jgi:hypothetical protein